MAVPGKPSSHYWFISPNSKSAVWKDVKDTGGKTATLVEIRSTGGYTVLPPSGHPSGDVLAWEIDRDAMVIDHAELYNFAKYVAISTLLARHWPGPGARHHAVGHMAGFLLQSGVPEMFVVPIIEAAATAAGDPDLHDRVTFAKNTVSKWQR
jgi:putative DNA primase/helicase